MPPSNTPPLLRELIDIPEPRALTDSDFVLALDRGVVEADATLNQYVVTDSLLQNFDEALNLIAAAVSTGSSKAAYLHGSFGSGKSHFMAVLHALLRGDAAARGRDEFADLLTKHDKWLQGRKFLMVPYHMIGALSIEQKVLGGYVDHIRHTRLRAPVPAVHHSESLLHDARTIRRHMGDEKFIATLPGGGDEDAWGETEARWDTDKLNAAFDADPADELRRTLVSDLLSTLLSGQVNAAAADKDAYILLDKGLEEISRHAKALKYDAVVLFLDELILWLANSVGDPAFVAREVQKITNFVEGSDSRRAIPIISFIARQRDLRELVGEKVTGAAELGFLDTLKLASGRFDTITLEDRNLPEIASKRLLAPATPDAAGQIDQAFQSTQAVRREVWDILLGDDQSSGADIDAFRATYPFSPAFMSTLVHVSSALQRSRTALKLMRSLLAHRRDELRLGQLVPLGDLYDEITRKGDQPFTERLKAEFEVAQRLYERKLRPHLLADHGLTEENLRAANRPQQTTEPDPQLAGRLRDFRGDDRLVKTMLLAALAPTVPALRDLTARRLAALNHGTIVSLIPGGEVSRVVEKVKNLASNFGEVKFREGDDPGVSIELVGVDVDSVLATAKHYDTIGARKNLVRDLLWQEMEITEAGYDARAEVTWRGSRRSLEVKYGNVRDPDEFRDDEFHPMDDTSWRLVIDYPWDEGTFGPADDRNRVDRLRATASSRTVCWVPAALTAARRLDLGQLVILENLLSGQRFDSHSGHLSRDDRRRARDTLTSQRDALRTKITGVLRQAYGLGAKNLADVGDYDDHLLSMKTGFAPKLQVGARFRAALEHIAGQMLAEQYPKHPDFDPDRRAEAVRPGDVRVVFGYMRKAAETDDGRVEIEKKDRATMRRIANPLGLGHTSEAAFVLDRGWAQHFEQHAAREGVDADQRAADLIRWLDMPEPRGLERHVAQLVLATYAEQTDRAWVRHGVVCAPQPDVTQITDDLMLRAQPLPSEDDWRRARHRMMAIFGRAPVELRRGRLLSMFARDLVREARTYRDPAHQLVEHLEQHAAVLGLDPAEGRLRTARAAAELLEDLSMEGSDLETIERLAAADLGDTADLKRIGRSIKSAEQLTRAIDQTPWDILDNVARLAEPHAAAAHAILERLRDSARADELTTPLASALQRARSDAGDLITRAVGTGRRADPSASGDMDGTAGAAASATPAPASRPTPTQAHPASATGTQEPATGAPQRTGQRRSVTTNTLEGVLAELRSAVREAPDSRFEVTWREVP